MAQHNLHNHLDRAYKILAEFNQYQDPQESIPTCITELTGITDAMVKGKAIDQEEVMQFLGNVDIIIAHNDVAIAGVSHLANNMLI